MHLRAIAADVYAREVLPLTASLWAGARDLETYKRQTTDLACSRYGRRNYRTIGLFDGAACVASCKRYLRTIEFERRRLRAVGFGAVFTAPELRGRGYATTLLAMLMDEARAGGVDVAYLFSDIQPAFYAPLGFKECPSHLFTTPSDSLCALRIRSHAIRESDWPEIAKCCRNLQALERWRFHRSSANWDWIRMRLKQRAANGIVDVIALAATSKNKLLAYVLGLRDARKDAFILEEFGWNDEGGGGAIGPLLRNAAGDLRRVTGWLPPSSALAPLKKLRVRQRKDALLMMAGLSKPGRLLAQVASGSGARDAVWANDHI